MKPVAELRRNDRFHQPSRHYWPAVLNVLTIDDLTWVYATDGIEAQTLIFASTDLVEVVEYEPTY